MLTQNKKKQSNKINIKCQQQIHKIIIVILCKQNIKYGLRNIINLNVMYYIINKVLSLLRFGCTK